MNWIILFLLTLIIASSGCSASKKELSGTWANDHARLELLSNGHGVFAGMALRWRMTDKGIRAVVGCDGSSVEMKFIFDKSSGVLILDGDKKREVLHKIKNAEPADYEGEIEQQQKQSHANMMKTFQNKQTNTYKNIEDAYAAIRQVSTNNANISLITEKKNQSIQLDNINGHAFLKFICRKAVQPIHKGDDDFWGDQPPPILHSNWAKTPPQASLPETEFVSKEKITELSAWLKDKNVEPRLEYLVHKSRWRTEGYTLYCSLHITNKIDKAIEITDFLRTHTLSPFEGPYKLNIIRR